MGRLLPQAILGGFRELVEASHPQPSSAYYTSGGASE